MIDPSAYLSERALILACAKRGLDLASNEQIRLALKRSISWDYVVAESERQGLLPLIAWHLRTAFTDVVPAPALAALKTRFDANAAATLRLTDELVWILEKLRANRIDALPYKGPALAMQAYGNIALRQSGDLDIFVRAKDVESAASLLIKHGYQRVRPTPARQEALLRWGHHDLFANSSGTCVELHWRTAKSIFSFGLDHDQLWDRTDPVHLAGDDVPAIGREDLLLMLAIHGSTHSWRRLEWIVSYAELARQTPEEDWSRILHRARELSCTRIVLVILLLASMVLGLRLPEIVQREAVADPAARTIALKLRSRIFSASDRMLGSVGYQFAVRRRVSDKLRLAFTSLFTPAHEDWEFVSLPDRLFPFYYVLRPVRLVTTYLLRRP